VSGEARSRRPPTVRDRLEYLGFRLVVGVLRLLPEGFANAIGSALGTFVGSVLRIRRDVVDGNLVRAVPDRASEERARLARASYRHLGREAVATFRLAYESAARVRERTEVEGLEALWAALAEGRPCLVVTGHLGNWEVGGAALAARGVPLDGIALTQRNPLFDRELVRNRARLGMEIIPRGGAGGAVRRSLSAGRVAGFVGDQNAGHRGVFVDFFGVPASTARGAALFAVRRDAALFVGAALRRSPGAPARYDVRIAEVEVHRTGDTEEDVRRATAAHTAALERWVREAPEQYFWVHKRWKTRPPE